MRLAVVGTGVAGAYLLNRLPPNVEAEAFEAKTEKNWYTVCAWGTSEPFITDLVKQAGFNFGDYVLHRGKKMTVDLGDEELSIPLVGLVTYDKHRLTEDMLKGKKVHWGAQIKGANGNLSGFDTVVDATGLHRSLLPKVEDDLLIPSLEYQVKSKDLPYDDFVIRPYPGITGYWWYFPLGDGMAHVGAGDLRGRYRYELDEFVKKYRCEVVKKIGRPVRVTPPKFMEPFYDGKVVGVGESIGTVYPMLGEGIIPSMQCVNLFVDHFGDREGYRKAVLDQYAIYAKVYDFIKAKVEDRFNLARMLPTLLSVYWYMRSNTRRYGLRTELSTFYKIVTRL
ncbi:MAG: NAD(P)/FAD-dependent oxidoreductase [Nitrososphaerota archaeon]|nr:NAD(P)/FAD-dependent oxidoreductase [Nitrososphaerota archaeon]MDG7023884.1 NAD(P)/FAD-dependent oxidoreductase [Nitrososphaerota archaeon]